MIEVFNIINLLLGLTMCVVAFGFVIVYLSGEE